MANIKVSESTRDLLAEIATELPSGRSTMEQVLKTLIAEYRATQAARLRAVERDAEFLARVEAARAEPLEQGYSTQEVLTMLAERQRDEAAA